jgi:hypothetical protein
MNRFPFLAVTLFGALGSLACDKPTGDETPSAPAAVGSEAKVEKPKELELLNVSYDPTRELNPTGSRTKIELRILQSGQLINAELTAERFADLALKTGDTVYVSARNARVFLPNVSI